MVDLNSKLTGLFATIITILVVFVIPLIVINPSKNKPSVIFTLIIGFMLGFMGCLLLWYVIEYRNAEEEERR